MEVTKASWISYSMYVCGSATTEGLSQVTLSPVLTLILCGEKVSQDAPFPPAATLTLDIAEEADKIWWVPVPPKARITIRAILPKNAAVLGPLVNTHDSLGPYGVPILYEVSFGLTYYSQSFLCRYLSPSCWCSWFSLCFKDLWEMVQSKDTTKKEKMHAISLLMQMQLLDQNPFWMWRKAYQRLIFVSWLRLIQCCKPDLTIRHYSEKIFHCLKVWKNNLGKQCAYFQVWRMSRMVTRVMNYNEYYNEKISGLEKKISWCRRNVQGSCTQLI